jgi:diguanylate cyclase (GGDEF)-like protein
MPTVVLGGLAVFPLTALETLLFSLPVIVAGIFGLLHGGTLFSLAEHGATLWFMLMMIGVSMFSGMSQCHYMATLIQRAASDPLTNAYTRDSGNETLDLVFRLADMGNKPLCLLFIDIDHFKTINDVYGHEAGDQTLRDMAEGIRECLRRSDHLIRWGGEEFVVVLPDTPLADVDILLRRLRRQAFGMRPDGTPLTASIGISEAKADHATNWHDMIRLADERMYQAKHAGRDRAVLPNGVTLTLVPENPA